MRVLKTQLCDVQITFCISFRGNGRSGHVPSEKAASRESATHAPDVSLSSPHFKLTRHTRLIGSRRQRIRLVTNIKDRLLNAFVPTVTKLILKTIGMMMQANTTGFHHNQCGFWAPPSIHQRDLHRNSHTLPKIVSTSGHKFENHSIYGGIASVAWTQIIQQWPDVGISD